MVPNLPIINPARPVTDESLSSLEAEFRRAALETVVSFVEPAGEDEPPALDVRVIRLFSREKVLWVELRLGAWWDSLEASRRDELLATLGRQLYAIDERAFNQKRDVILTAKDPTGRRLGDATVTPFSANVRLATRPASAAPPQAATPSALPR
ncbi:MAG: hypothetical protein ACE5KY_02705 [Candidatus Tectimicrobiota bacterium]